MADEMEHKAEIAQMASAAVKVIADAAAEATRVVSTAAAESARILNVKGPVDHDLLIELKTRMEGLKSDIKDLKDGTSTQLAQHESRLTMLESSRTKQNVTMSIGIGLLSILVGLLIYHIAK